ncbi:MAG TPA: LysR family transcriptional regulator [Gemmataceae bacterium]|nr:LysR family transcriptional regulator [Gemmataceae bacterium]
MQLETLKVFCDVARQRSFSQAAQANDITQSAASQIVSMLERRMQVQLIDRSTRPLQLTSLGQTYYEGCKSLLAQYLDLEESIKTAHTRIAGMVQVAAIYSVGLGDMGQYVERFTTGQPGAQVHIEYLHPDRVYDRVLEGTADLGLVSFPKKSPKLTALPWREEAMVLVCAPKHPLAHNGAVQPRQLAGQKFIHFDRNLMIRRQVDRFLREQGAGVEVVLEFDNIENIKQAVALGAGVALLPEPTVRREVRARTLAAMPLVGSTLTRPLGIIHRRRNKLSAAAQCFLDLLRADGNGQPAAHQGRNGVPRNHTPGAKRKRGSALNEV